MHPHDSIPLLRERLARSEAAKAEYRCLLRDAANLLRQHAPHLVETANMFSEASSDTLDDIGLDFIQANAALRSVVDERARQHEKWGEQNHDPITWVGILTEEIGEFAQAALHAKFGGHAATGLREEAVQCAAVALQIVQCLDRNRWQWPQSSRKRRPSPRPN